MDIFNTARFDDFSRGAGAQSHVFTEPEGGVIARIPAEVGPALLRVERAVEAGLHAVGYLSYEAASGLDARLQTHELITLPLVHFCFYRTRRTIAPGEGLPVRPCPPLLWEPMQSRGEYDEAIEAIRTHLVAGDTYQVNYTFRLRAPLGEDPLRLYAGLARAQQAPFAAYLDGGDHAILSASPELFFRLKDGVLEARPMKGTRERGRWFAEDLAMADGLTSSPKERAENVMITDMLRNDLGRISTSGSVVVPSLFQAERYPTLWQLTSTVQSELAAGVNIAQLFAALFPCASVTGAPKVRTMEIIRDLEAQPRGVYTGSIGYVSPGLEACFNVAIRTAHLNRLDGWLEYGVGGGITWDSSADSEYDECLVKARVLSRPRADFKLLETLLWEEGAYYLLDRHVERVAQSAEYWGYICDIERVTYELEKTSKTFGQCKMRVRLLVSDDGTIEVVGLPLRPFKRSALRAHWAPQPVDRMDPLLYHKTTQRQVYERALKGVPEGDEVLLYNRSGELTEFCIGNLVVELEGQRWTPPVACGLLPGTLRAELLALQSIEERILYAEDVERAEGIFLINSVRGLVPIESNIGGKVCIASEKQSSSG